MKFPKPIRVTRKRAPSVTGSRKVKTAIEAMVFEGLKRQDAAKRADLQDNSLYVALRRPDVLAYYRQCCDVLRESERARSIHRLTEIRDRADNMPAVNAAKWLLDQGNSDSDGRASGMHPGVTIVIEGDASARNVRATPESVTISTGSAPLRRELSPPSPLDEDAAEPTPGGKNGPRSGRW